MPIWISRKVAKSQPRLFCFGLGYSAGVLAERLFADGWSIAGTCRYAEQRDDLEARGYDAYLFDGKQAMADASAALAGVTHVLSSIPPGIDFDPVVEIHGTDIRRLEGLKWAGYLSTAGVYGDTGGAMVDESSPLEPTSERSRRRVKAEAAWLGMEQVPVHVFRLPGIYGPGRSALDRVKAGVVRIEKPGHKFSRIHVDDIANTLVASIARPNPGAIYNVCDDEAVETSEIAAFASELLGMEPPAAVPFVEAAKEMSEMAMSFWHDNRMIDNTRIKKELGVKLKYPDYRAGLRAIFNDSQSSPTVSPGSE